MAKTFTTAELAKNVGERMAEDDRPSSEKMMITIDDYVYDVTNFAKLQPWGVAVLKQVAGQDATE
jgi:cytochrome b involved in lipid metabolism